MQTAKQNWFEDKCQERGQPKPNSSKISYQAVKELTKRKQDRVSAMQARLVNTLQSNRRSWTGEPNECLNDILKIICSSIWESGEWPVSGT